MKRLLHIDENKVVNKCFPLFLASDVLTLKVREYVVYIPATTENICNFTISSFHIDTFTFHGGIR